MNKCKTKNNWRELNSTKLEKNPRKIISSSTDSENSSVFTSPVKFSEAFSVSLTITWNNETTCKLFIQSKHTTSFTLHDIVAYQVIWILFYVGPSHQLMGGSHSTHKKKNNCGLSVPQSGTKHGGWCPQQEILLSWGFPVTLWLWTQIHCSEREI